MPTDGSRPPIIERRLRYLAVLVAALREKSSRLADTRLPIWPNCNGKPRIFRRPSRIPRATASCGFIKSVGGSTTEPYGLTFPCRSHPPIRRPWRTLPIVGTPMNSGLSRRRCGSDPLNPNHKGSRAWSIFLFSSTRGKSPKSGSRFPTRAPRPPALRNRGLCGCSGKQCARMLTPTLQNPENRPL
jgi:hypothetical protein